MDRRDLFKKMAVGLVSASVFGHPVVGTDSEQDLVVIGKGQKPAQIVIGSQPTTIETQAAAAVQDEVWRRTGIKLPIQQSYETNGATALLLGTLDRNSSLCSSLLALGRRPVGAADPGREGFLLISGSLKGLGTIIINGCDGQGTFHGAGWLLRKMSFSDDGVRLVQGLRISTAPATPMRRIRFGDAEGYVNMELPGWTSVVTSKPAIGGRVKTGQWEAVRD